jgi:uncharacterized protein YcbX
MTPVKSLGMRRLERARVSKGGLEGDRKFFLGDINDKIVTVRQQFDLVQVTAEYDTERDWLQLGFPGGNTVEGPAAALGDLVTIKWGEADVPGRLVPGDFSDALSAFAGRRVNLLRSDGRAMDALPVSFCSLESVAELARVAGASAVDERRFRQNIWLSGVDVPHGEDIAIGGNVRIGDHVVLRAIMRDQRCVVTTRSPDTGDHDMDTLKLITSYRTDLPGEVSFGVYAGVATTGEIKVGDEVVFEPASVAAEAAHAD